MNVPCELCKKKARIRCDSDKASLCWDCDAYVHSANFLAARHFRKLLCSACQSPTPWAARGSALRSSVSFCGRCRLSSGRGRFRKEVEENSSCDDDCSSSHFPAKKKRRRRVKTTQMNPDRSEESDSCGEILTVDSSAPDL
ncbi:hypothetical protein M569_10978 [Genlisea aurea]|uniref:B box-type domain-containing protein n=1 Tax=Genlisea aurea TaxID=192259 RepID=S8CAC9_9LAMI|nr:hypothetical protein M569_10978 [Genlisea aurea]